MTNSEARKREAARNAAPETTCLREAPTGPTIAMVDTLFAQVALDREVSAYWQERSADLDSTEAYLASLRDWLAGADDPHAVDDRLDHDRRADCTFPSCLSPNHWPAVDDDSAPDLDECSCDIADRFVAGCPVHNAPEPDATRTNSNGERSSSGEPDATMSDPAPLTDVEAGDVDWSFARRLADALIDAMCKAEPGWDKARANEVRSHMRTALAAVGVTGVEHETGVGQASERWECGPHANAWGGHDARCRKVADSNSEGVLR